MAPRCCWPAVWHCGVVAVAELNLLPWREAARISRRRQFQAWLWGVVVAVVLLLCAGDRYMNHALAQQRERNAGLHARIATLDKGLDEDHQLQARIATLTEQLAALQALQRSSSRVAQLLEALVHTLPAGLYYDSLSRRGDFLTLVGVSESPQQISLLRRALERSSWFDVAVLRQVSAVPELATAAPPSEAVVGQRHRFQLELTLAAPGTQEVQP